MTAIENQFRKSWFSKKPMTPIKFLYSVEKVVECSFIVQKSITHLDLSFGEFSRFKRKMQKRNIFTSNSISSTATEKNIVFTEEGIRKLLAPDRNILYDLHLDVSKELELSLRHSKKQEILPCHSSSVLINKIVFETALLETKFNRTLSELFREKNQEVKYIHHVSKLAKCFKFISKYEHVRSLNVLCFQGADSAVVVDFLTNMDFDCDNLLTLLVEVVEFVLCRTNQARFNLWTLSDREMIHSSIVNHMYVKTEALLQYRDAQRFCTKVYGELKTRTESYDVIKKGPACPIANGLITKERHFLILQIFCVFRGNRLGGLKALQMLWRSIPDPFITVDELTSVFSEQRNSRFTETLCDFIQDITGEEVTEGRCQPRKLKHKCRTIIRRSLSNNFRLSTGIGELNLPPSVAAFLRLEH